VLHATVQAKFVTISFTNTNSDKQVLTFRSILKRIYNAESIIGESISQTEVHTPSNCQTVYNICQKSRKEHINRATNKYWEAQSCSTQLHLSQSQVQQSSVNWIQRHERQLSLF
jgi:hypothetical protein